MNQPADTPTLVPLAIQASNPGLITIVLILLIILLVIIIVRH